MPADCPSKSFQPSFGEVALPKVQMVSPTSIHRIHGSEGRLMLDGSGSHGIQKYDIQKVSVPRRELYPMKFFPRMMFALAAYGGVVGEVQDRGSEGSNGARAGRINDIYDIYGGCARVQDPCCTRNGQHRYNVFRGEHQSTIAILLGAPLQVWHVGATRSNIALDLREHLLV